MNQRRASLILAWCLSSLATTCPAATPKAVPDHPFPQEVAHRHGTPPGVEATNIQWVEPDGTGSARAFAAGQWFQLKDGQWSAIPNLTSPDRESFVFPDPGGKPVTAKVAWPEVRQLIHSRDGRTSWVATRKDPFRIADGQTASMGWPSRWEVRQIAASPEGELWVASSGGLMRQRPNGWMPVGISDGLGRGWAVVDVRGVALDSQGHVWVAVPAGIIVGDGSNWQFFEGRDGVPYTNFTTVAAAPDGATWFGTRIGAIRHEGSNWAYRQGGGWLPGDDVASIAVDTAGTAWFVTSGGIGSIERRPMTLAAKAEFYEEEVEKYIKRTPFGYTSEVGLANPGDRSKVSLSDSDNDGLWTAMYGAGECFAYAATKKPVFRDRAKQAFEALRFLQKVTQGGPHSPPKGFVARTVRPVEWPDPNVGSLESDKREQQHGDRLWKAYEPRWPKSADGKWYWKSDTSSDELDGHFFLHARYYDLVADDAEKERVREVVRDLADHFLTHDFALVDHDGTPTRWGHFGPRDLNTNPSWWVERGLNSLSMVSYLTVASHITGEPRFAEAVRQLIDVHGYASNLMNPKLQTGIGSGNQSDDEMAFMCFYNLMGYSKETAWLPKWLFAFHTYGVLEHPEMNPFFNFAYAAYGLDATYHNPWGDFSITPWAGWLEDSMTTLRGFPLDRCNWGHRNSHRTDIVRLPAQHSADVYEPKHGRRGYRVNGKVLPVEERHFNHWNTDPWELDYGGDGRGLASGTVFLLPYYMGLYHGFIGLPGAPAGR